jgi:hypothetical protein
VLLIPFSGFIAIKFWGGHIQESAQLGDTFGGLMGPFIAMFAACLTFIAFYVQYQANQQQKMDLEIERFESKFFELINLHKQNVSEIKLEDGKQGREAFVSFYYELKLANNLVESINQTKNKLNKEGCNLLAYKVFFFGMGENSEKQYEVSDSEDSVLKDVKNVIITWRAHNQKEYFKLIVYKENVYQLLENYKSSNNLIFDGHISQLSHYYRHLFQTVRFVVDQLPGSFTGVEREKKAREYLRILRAQLSNHEQILLYYNGSSIAKQWFTKDYFTQYKMIHNIPLPLADFGLPPNEHSEIITWREENVNDDLFEWDG